MSQYEMHKVGRTTLGLLRMPHVESASIGLWFPVGSRHESAKMNGSAHFIEHMLFKGTAKRNTLEISQCIESVGGDLNAFTSEEMTCYYAKLGSDHIDMALDVLCDMLWHSKFLTREVERERGVIEEEIKMYEDQPHYYVCDLLNELLWKGVSLGRPITGTLQSVSKIQSGDLIDFWKTHYTPENLTVVVAGYFEEARLDQWIHEQTRSVQRKLKRHDVIKFEPPAYKSLHTRAVARELQQVQLALGCFGYARRDERRYAEKVMAILLGGNMSSRLFQIVREKYGLAYSIQTSSSHFIDTGAFYIQAGLERNNLEKLIKILAKELKRLKDKLVTKKELEQAKEYIIGQMKLGLESTSNQMMWMGESIIGRGDILDPHVVIEKVRAVTTRDVQSIARDLFCPGRMRLVCLGPDLTDAGLKTMAESLNKI
ncbi:MAG: pitrilysin family protein [Verrucomicrobiota bacterium]